MAVSYSDKAMLGADVTFQARVKQALLTACVQIKNEAVTTAFHRERETYLIAIMNSPDAYKVLFSAAIANDGNIIGDATVGGTIVLTSGNVGTQGALVTDAHLDAAISGMFNSFFRTPAS